MRNNEFTHKELLEYIEDESAYDMKNKFEEMPMTINEARRASTQQSQITQEDISQYVAMQPTNQFNQGYEGNVIAECSVPPS